MENKMKSAIKRIQSLKTLPTNSEASPSDVLIAREYLRRVALMAKALPEWKSGPFFDPKIVTEAELDATVKTEIEAVLNPVMQPNAYVRKLCADYIKWQAYVGIGNVVASSYADIYEPLLILFERGQDIGLHHGELMIGSFAVPLNRWLESANLAPVNLSSESSEGY